MKSFNESVLKKFDECAKLMFRKQRDYGHGNILNSPIDPRLAVLVRLNDKLQRASNLLSKGQEPELESLKDTFMDITNYGIILLMLQDHSFELELE